MARATNKASSKKTTAKKNAPQVYVGPNISGDILITQFSTFRNGLPATMKAAVEADKNLETLFVAVNDLAEARQQIKFPSTRLGRAFAAVMRDQAATKEV